MGLRLRARSHRQHRDDVVHLLSGLNIGGKEAAALRAARRGIADGTKHRLLLFDTPFRSSQVDFDPTGVPTDFLARRGGIDFKFAVALSGFLKKINPKLVHAYNDTAIFYTALARIIGFGNYGIIGTFHAWPVNSTSKARHAVRWACRHIDKTTAVSWALRDRLVDAGWLDICDVIPNGVDLHRYKPLEPNASWRSDLSVPANAFLVGNIARFDPIKRQIDLVEAAKILKREESNIVIVFVGQGPLLKEIKRLAENDANIRFVEQTSETPCVMASLGAFALCSLYEAAPLVLLEAMACGLPIVATDVGGIREMVGTSSSERCALLVPPQVPSELARALIKIETDPELRADLRRKALARATAHSFDEEWRQYSLAYARFGVGQG